MIIGSELGVAAAESVLFVARLQLRGGVVFGRTITRFGAS
jgi:hypothetical protein